MPVEKTIKSGFADVPGARLYYEIAGEGDPVLLLHGGLLDRRMWDGQFPFFAQHAQTIRYALRCSGESQSLPSTEPCVPNQDASHLLQALSIGQATLVGLSGGARFALDLAIASPEVVRKLVLVSPGMSGYEFVDAWTGRRAEELKMAVMQGDLARAVGVFLVMWTDDIQAIGELLHRQVAGSELVLMPGVGHMLVMEKPAAFNVLAAQFLRW